MPITKEAHPIQAMIRIGRKALDLAWRKWRMLLTSGWRVAGSLSRGMLRGGGINDGRVHLPVENCF